MMRRLVLLVALLSAPHLCAQTLDTYGGDSGHPCVGGSGATGYFYVYKDTSIKHWMFCDPLGNRFFLQGAQHITDTTYNINVATKYAGVNGFTGREEFYRVMVTRLQNMGFNTASEVSNIFMYPVGTSDPNGVAMPFSFLTNPARYAVWNDVMTGIGLTPVKSLIPLLPTPYNSFQSFHGVLGWRASDGPDYWDPNWTNYINNHFTDLNARILDWVSAATLDASPYYIATCMGDSDDQWAMRGAHGGWIIGTNPPYIQYMMTAAFNKEFLYTDTKSYAKAQFQTFLMGKYANVAGLNTAWGSNYTTLGSTATTVSGETVGTGTGSQTSFTHTVAHALVDPGSVLVSVGGTASGGDCPWFESYCNNSVASGIGNIRGLASNINPNGGTISYSTYTLGSSSQLASDNFTRADANPLSGNWSTISTINGLKIVSNAVNAVSNNANMEYSTGATWPNDQYSEITLGTAGASGSPSEARVRQTTNDFGGYACQASGAFGASVTLAIQKQDNVSDNYHSIATGTFTVSSGDVIRCSVVGNSLYLSQNGTVKLSGSDGTYTSGKAAVGMFCPGTCGTITAWAGGSATQNANPGSITVTFSSAPANGVAITMTYQYGGWPAGLSGGTGLLDEDGSHSWYPAQITYPLSGTVMNDLDTFYGQYVARFHSTMNTAIKANLPHHLITNTDPSAADLPPSFWANVAPYVDYLFMGNADTDTILSGNTGQVNATTAYNQVTKPVMVYDIIASSGDSPFTVNCATIGVPCGTNQQARGQLYQKYGKAWWSNYIGSDGYGFVIGRAYWSMADTNGTDFGLSSLNDNLYNGIEDTTTSLKDKNGFVTTAETGVYGDFISGVQWTNKIWLGTQTTRRVKSTARQNGVTR